MMRVYILHVVYSTCNWGTPYFLHILQLPHRTLHHQLSSKMICRQPFFNAFLPFFVIFFWVDVWYMQRSMNWSLRHLRASSIQVLSEMFSQPWRERATRPLQFRAMARPLASVILSQKLRLSDVRCEHPFASSRRPASVTLLQSNRLMEVSCGHPCAMSMIAASVMRELPMRLIV